ncbi:trans-2,3-enoyl-CoA reductase b isoform 3-T3 [Salvelinus alpinus]
MDTVVLEGATHKKAGPGSAPGVPAPPVKRPKAKKAKKAVVFFEVEILDAKTKDKLCFLDKVEPNATIGEIKSMFHKSHPQWYAARQSIRLDPKGKSLKDEDVLQHLPVGTTATFYFRDLGAQISWVTSSLYVSLLPLPEETSGDPVCPSLLPRDHAATQHLQAIYGEQQVRIALIIFLFCQVGNFSIHIALRNLRPPGSKTRKIPYPTKNPFTWIFLLVSCPNYTYELGSWFGFTLMTQCLPVAFFTAVGFIQMTVWAKGKHRSYLKEFRDYPPLRSPILPFVL